MTLRTLLVALVLSLIATPALAAHSKLVITVDRPIAVFVDGQMLEFEDGTTSVELVGIEPGRHLVEFRNFVGKVVGTGEVRVPTEAPAIVRARWAGKQFSVYDTVLLEPREQVVVVEHHTTVVEPVETVHVSASMGGVGMSASAGFGHVDANVSMGVSAGVSTGVSYGVTETVVHETTVVETRPGSALVTFRVTDDESVNVWVDGKRVWAYHVGRAEKSVELSTGEHHVEFKNFMEDATLCRGQLYVDRDLVVGFSQAGCAEVFNAPGAFARR